jgi:hypothetical protein
MPSRARSVLCILVCPTLAVSRGARRILPLHSPVTRRRTPSAGRRGYGTCLSRSLNPCSSTPPADRDGCSAMATEADYPEPGHVCQLEHLLCLEGCPGNAPHPIARSLRRDRVIFGTGARRNRHARPHLSRESKPKNLSWSFVAVTPIRPNYLFQGRRSKPGQPLSGLCRAVAGPWSSCH